MEQKFHIFIGSSLIRNTETVSVTAISRVLNLCEYLTAQ